MEPPVLTTEERHRLLTVLRELDPHAPPEKRRHPRRRIQLNLTLRPVDARRTALPARLTNVSLHGVCLQVQSPLAPGTKFLLPLRFAEGGGWLVLCEVRNCSPSRHAFRLGARFVDRIDDPTGASRPPLDWLL